MMAIPGKTGRQVTRISTAASAFPECRGRFPDQINAEGCHSIPPDAVGHIR